MLTSEDRQYLLELEEAIRKKDLSAMIAWAVFWTVEHPEEPLSPRQADQVVEYYGLGVQNGDALSCLNLGALYYTGVIVEQDFSKAVGLYQMAARLAEEEEEDSIAALALSNLGYCYYYGRDIPVDYAKAYHCFLYSALKFHDVTSYYKAGDMYRYGNYVGKDEDIAFLFYQKAEEALDEENDPEHIAADVYKRLGECRLYGIGTQKSPFLARAYLHRSEQEYKQKVLRNDPFAPGLLVKVQSLLNEVENEIYKRRDR